MIAAMILLICATAGAWTSFYMTLKYYRLKSTGHAGEERSVVQTPYARIFILPNSLYGLVFYLGVLVIALTRIITGRWALLLPAFVAAVIAAIFSIYLAWSLIFKLRQPCPLCFTSHVLNGVIAAVLGVLFFGNYR